MMRTQWKTWVLSVFYVISFAYLKAFPFFITVPSAEWSGAQSIRHTEYQKALDEILADTTFTDTVFRYFKLGIIHKQHGDISKALFYFRLTAQSDNPYTAYAYEEIGEIEQSQKRYESALIAFRVAAVKADNPEYRFALFKKMYTLAKAHEADIGNIAWLEEQMGEEKISPDTVQEKLKDVFMQLISAKKSTELDSALISFIDTSMYNDIQCYVCSVVTIDTCCQSEFSTKTLFLLSRLSYVCKRYDWSSAWLHKALNKKNFSEQIARNTYLYHRTVLNYQLKNYNNVIEWANKYLKNYAPQPELVYYLARAYRFSGRARQANHWYDKHIQLFPEHEKSYDIIWYRAWQKEDGNKFDESRNLFKTLYEKGKKGSKADDAFFRYALSYCKEKKYTAGQKAFTAFIRRYPYSPLLLAAHYWKAKCYFGLKKYEKAQQSCSQIISLSPVDYYAYRARELLLLMGDTIKDIEIDTTFTCEQVAQWLDSVSTRKVHSLSKQDSIQLLVGANLAALGMIEKAEYLLKPFEYSFSHHLLFQYELARLYEICDAHAYSFRIAHRLSWRIPTAARSKMPLQIYSLLYPDSFEDHIKKGAEVNEVEPELLQSIIRQESIFNASIVSPVGAIGLMQIMPYTGKEIANDLKELFSVDSLYNPSYNVRFGAYYIKKILNQFKGNIVLALAGYNGGPHNARRWHAQNSDDGFDMFVEDIGFSETRGYVKKVLSNYWTYKYLKKFHNSNKAEYCF